MPIPTYPVWSIPPNWREVVTETPEWKTDILTSPTGIEQRRKLRISPRSYIDYTITVDSVRRTLADMLLMNYGADPFFSPLWYNQADLITQIQSGDAVINCVTNYLQFIPGEYAIVWLNELVFEIVSIESTSPTQIELSSPVAGSYGTTAKIYPVKPAILTAQPSFNRLSDGIYEGEIKFQSIVPNDFTTSELILDNYLGYSVMSIAPDEGVTMTFAYQRLTKQLDNTVGLLIQQDTAEDGFPSQQFSFFLHGVVEKYNFRNLLYSLDGRQKALWVPTFFRDFEIVASQLAADTTLTIKACGYTSSGGPQSGRRFIRIELYSGASLYKRVTDSAMLGLSAELITLNEALGQDLPISSVKRISFMSIARIDQDSIDIVHQTDAAGVAIGQLVFRALPTSFLSSGWGFGWGVNYGGLTVGEV